MADPVWELSDDAIDIIVHSLGDQEPDHIVRFYACKTLENICAQSQTTGSRFATAATAKRVLAIFTMEREPWADQAASSGGYNTARPVSAMSSGLGGKSFAASGEQPQSSDSETNFQSYLQWYDGIRISAAIALSHICKLKPELFPEIFETLGLEPFCDVLMHGNGQYRVQQAFIFMLNLALHNVNQINYSQISKKLMKEQAFFTAVQKLLEHQHIVIRGKVVMTILLLINIDFTWIAAVQHRIHFFNELDKLLRDNYKYVQCSLLCLAEGIAVTVPQILKAIATSLLHTLQNPTAPAPGLQGPVLPTPSPYADLSLLESSPLSHLSLLLDL
jgi:hypothetical protein